jgi:hypothetical protein
MGFTATLPTTGLHEPDVLLFFVRGGVVGGGVPLTITATAGRARGTRRAAEPADLLPRGDGVHGGLGARPAEHATAQHHERPMRCHRATRVGCSGAERRRGHDRGSPTRTRFSASLRLAPMSIQIGDLDGLLLVFGLSR